MTGNEIISNMIDLAGASLVEKLETHTAVLHYLNCLDDRNLELSNSSRGQRFYQITDATFNAASGTFADTTIKLRPSHVRYIVPQGSTSRRPQWRVIDIVDNIEALTSAANQGREAVFFTAVSPIAWRLSFTPDTSLTVQMFGKKLGADETDLATEPDFPVEFGRLIALEGALMMLDEVLLLDDAQKYQAFVQSRSLKLAGQFKRAEWIWDNYRANESESMSQSRPYDVFEQDYGDVIEDGGVRPI